MKRRLGVQSRMRTSVRIVPAHGAHTHAPITSCVVVVLASAGMATAASGTGRQGRASLCVGCGVDAPC